MDIATLIFAGFLDRVRGGYPNGRPTWVAHLATSTACALMAWLPTQSAYAALFGLLWGEVAWRQDNGWRGHWLRDDYGKRWWQPFRWGAIWSAPVVLVAYWHPVLLWYYLAAPIGAWLAIQISCALPTNGYYTTWSSRVLGLKHAWPWSELIELPIIGGLMLWIEALHLFWCCWPC